MTDPAPTVKKRSKAKLAGIIIGVVIGVAIAGYLVVGLVGFTSSMSKSQAIANMPERVTVSGSVSTAGYGSHPVSVVFVDDNTGDRITGGVSGSDYQVVLPNGNHNWRVLVGWQGIAGANGECAASGLSYSNTYDSSRYLSLRC